MNFRFIELPEQQRFEYNKTFEQLYRYASDVQDKLPVFACYLQEDMLRKLFTMVRYLHREVDSSFTLSGWITVVQHDPAKGVPFRWDSKVLYES